MVKFAIIKSLIRLSILKKKPQAYKKIIVTWFWGKIGIIIISYNLNLSLLLY